MPGPTLCHPGREAAAVRSRRELRGGAMARRAAATIRDRTMAVDWARHGRRLAKMSHADFCIAFAAELADLRRGVLGPISGGRDVGGVRPASPARGGRAEDRRSGHRGQQVDSGRPERSRETRSWRPSSPTQPPDSTAARSSARTRYRLVTREAEPGRVRPQPRAAGAIFPLRVALVPDTRPLVLWVGGLGRFEGAHLSLDREAQAPPRRCSPRAD